MSAGRLCKNELKTRLLQCSDMPVLEHIYGGDASRIFVIHLFNTDFISEHIVIAVGWCTNLNRVSD